MNQLSRWLVIKKNFFHFRIKSFPNLLQFYCREMQDFLKLGAIQGSPFSLLYFSLQKHRGNDPASRSILILLQGSFKFFF